MAGPSPAAFARGLRARVAVVGVAVACGFAAVPALAGAAEDPACPVRPPAFVPSDPALDSDPVVAELRALRQDVAAACAVQVWSLPDVQRVRLDGVDAEHPLPAHDADRRAELAGVDAAHPLPTHDGDQRASLALDDESTGALGEAFAGSVAVLHADVWFLCGLLVALPFSYFLVRLVLARA
jgi:hypothetical protein